MYPQRVAGLASSLAIALLTLFSSADCASAQNTQQVPLGYGIPDDAHYYVHGLTSETPDPGMIKLERALRHLMDSGIHEDIFDLATIDQNPEWRAESKAVFDRLIGLCGLVDWSLLGERELVFAYTMSLPLPEYIALFRVPEDRIAAQVEGMDKLLSEFAGMIGVEMSSLRPIELQAGQMKVLEINGAPVQLAAGAIGDVLVLSSSSRLAISAVKKLAKGDGRGSLVKSERFQSSLERLPKATEATIFVDLDGMFGFLKQAMVLSQAKNAGGANTQQAQMISLMSAIFEELDVCEHVLVTSESDGQSMTSTALMAMQPGYEDSSLAKLFSEQQPWSEWTRFVPADASEFYFDSGFDLAGLCDLGIQLVKENLREPGIPVMVMSQLRDQVLSNISGESAYVMLPTLEPGGCVLGDMVTFWRLESSEGVLRSTERMLEGVADLLATRGQELDFVSQENSLELVLPAFPWIRPTIAIREGCLVVATSPAALAKVDLVYAGEEPSIRSREDFAELGIGKDQDARYLGYGHMDTGMEGLGNLVSAAGFFLSVLPEEKDTRAAIKLGAVLTKLAPALRELQMEFDWGTEILPSTTKDVIMSRSVYQYR